MPGEMFDVSKRRPPTDLPFLEVVPKPSDGQRVPLICRAKIHHNRVLGQLQVPVETKTVA